MAIIQNNINSNPPNPPSNRASVPNNRNLSQDEEEFPIDLAQFQNAIHLALAYRSGNIDNIRQLENNMNNIMRELEDSIETMANINRAINENDVDWSVALNNLRIISPHGNGWELQVGSDGCLLEPWSPRRARAIYAGDNSEESFVFDLHDHLDEQKLLADGHMGPMPTRPSERQPTNLCQRSLNPPKFLKPQKFSELREPLREPLEPKPYHLYCSTWTHLTTWNLVKWSPKASEINFYDRFEPLDMERPSWMQIREEPNPSYRHTSDHVEQFPRFERAVRECRIDPKDFTMPYSTPTQHGGSSGFAPDDFANRPVPELVPGNYGKIVATNDINRTFQNQASGPVNSFCYNRLMDGSLDPEELHQGILRGDFDALVQQPTVSQGGNVQFFDEVDPASAWSFLELCIQQQLQNKAQTTQRSVSGPTRLANDPEQNSSPGFVEHRANRANCARANTMPASFQTATVAVGASADDNQHHDQHHDLTNEEMIIAGNNYLRQRFPDSYSPPGPSHATLNGDRLSTEVKQWLEYEFSKKLMVVKSNSQTRRPGQTCSSTPERNYDPLGDRLTSEQESREASNRPLGFTGATRAI